MEDLYARWAESYDYFYPDRSGEVRFWAELVGPEPQRVLDLMCGTAEVSLALARQGHRLLGIDRSPAMLDVAADRLAAAADYPARNLALVQADASAIPAPAHAFDVALVGGNGSFNHLDDELAPRALTELGRVLRPEGTLGLELINPYILKEVYPVRTFGSLRPTPPGVQVEKISENRYDPEAARFHIRQVTRLQIDKGHAEFEVSFSLHVRKPEEMQLLLEASGFGTVRFFGSYDLVPFTRWSSDLLVVASLP
jgi:ubiquinone/menaquinone biosynthesis C-methylase UbiE